MLCVACTQSINSFDEALALPTDFSARLARNTQLILQVCGRRGKGGVGGRGKDGVSLGCWAGPVRCVDDGGRDEMPDVNRTPPITQPLPEPQPDLYR